MAKNPFNVLLNSDSDSESDSVSDKKPEINNIISATTNLKKVFPDDLEMNNQNKYTKKNFPHETSYKSKRDFPDKSKRDFPEYQESEFIEIKKEVKEKKVFSKPTKKNETNLVLPPWYQTISGTNKYEIVPYKPERVRQMGGLEKSESNEIMFQGIIACAISIFDDKEYMISNKYFRDRYTVNYGEQEELLEDIMIQIASILFHRLIKSDSSLVLETICNNLPLYSIVQGNPLEKTQFSRGVGANTYMRIKQKWINLHRKTGKETEAVKQEKLKSIGDIKKKWTTYMLQSVWNGNNPIHDILYYGAINSFKTLLTQYNIHKMQKELYDMLSVANIQKENHRDIICAGKKACEESSNYLFRRRHFEDCENIYNNTIQDLKQVIQDEVVVEVKIDKPVLETLNNNSDTKNIFQMLQNGYTVEMVDFLMSNKDNVEVLDATITLWKEMISNQSNLQDYLTEVIECCESDGLQLPK